MILERMHGKGAPTTPDLEHRVSAGYLSCLDQVGCERLMRLCQRHLPRSKKRRSDMHLLVQEPEKDVFPCTRAVVFFHVAQ